MDLNSFERQNIGEYLEKNGFIAVTISGYSMYPMLKDRRDCAVIKRYEGGACKYDVLLYHNGRGKLILHRVVKNTRKNGCLVIRGDNCFTTEYIPEGNVMGILTEFTRKNKDFKVNDGGYRVYSRLIVFFSPFVRAKMRILTLLVGLKNKLGKR